MAEFQWLFPGTHQWWEKSDFSVSLASLIQFISKAYSTAFQLHSESNYFSLFLQLPPWPRLLSALAWSIIIASELVFVLPIFSPVGSLWPPDARLIFQKCNLDHVIFCSKASKSFPQYSKYKLNSKIQHDLHRACLSSSPSPPHKPSHGSSCVWSQLVSQGYYNTTSSAWKLLIDSYISGPFNVTFSDRPSQTVFSKWGCLPLVILNTLDPLYFASWYLHYLNLYCYAKSLQSCPTLCDPIDGSPTGSPIPGILQARTLEWVAISFSNAGKWKVKVKSLSRLQLFATPWTAAYQTPPSMGFSKQEYWSGVPLPSPKFILDIHFFGKTL